MTISNFTYVPKIKDNFAFVDQSKLNSFTVYIYFDELNKLLWILKASFLFTETLINVFLFRREVTAGFYDNNNRKKQ